MSEFNIKEAENAYKRLKEEAQSRKIDISNPYLDKICKKTKSGRILKLIEEAYFLGIAQGIKRVDSGFNTIILS